MNNFKKTNEVLADFNPFEKIGNEWMLITSGNEQKFNSMTASWGGVGVLWGKNVVFVFIRPQRYTMEFIEKNDCFSLSFFNEEYKNILSFCGAKSGRDVDKAKECGFTPFFADDTVGIEQASLVITCKKMYNVDISKDDIIDKSIMDFYKDNDFHKMYVAEILNTYQK